MFDLMQMYVSRHIVEAHGMKWVLLYKVPGGDKDAQEVYLAVPAEAVIPAPVQVIRLEKPLAEQEIERIFDNTWTKLSNEGACDAPGGAEHDRVKAEWVAAGRPGFTMEKFIREHANVGPW